MTITYLSETWERYYDVYSKGECDSYINIAKKHLADSLLIEGDNKNGRVSRSAFYSDTDPKAQAWMDKINSRIEAMNAKKMSSDDEIQIANYGIGGHYFPHYDSNMKDSNPRYATWLGYLSDVEQGGATVFLFPKLTVYPGSFFD